MNEKLFSEEFPPNVQVQVLAMKIDFDLQKLENKLTSEYDDIKDVRTKLSNKIHEEVSTVSDKFSADFSELSDKVNSHEDKLEMASGNITSINKRLYEIAAGLEFLSRTFAAAIITGVIALLFSLFAKSFVNRQPSVALPLAAAQALAAMDISTGGHP